MRSISITKIADIKFNLSFLISNAFLIDQTQIRLLISLARNNVSFVTKLEVGVLRYRDDI